MKITLLLIGLTVIRNSMEAQNVGIGTITPSARLHIKGAADTTQFIVDANSTQSNMHPLIKLRNSSGTDLMWIHSDHPSNCFVGLNAGRVNDTSIIYHGIYNTFIGSGTGFSHTTGYANTANGYQALYFNTTGNYNTANGISALFHNTMGSLNTAIGGYALYNNSTAGGNVAIGQYTLWYQNFSNANTEWSSDNVAIGNNALFYNYPTSTTNGISNTAVGTNTLFSNTTGYDNTAIGAGALYTNSTGYENTAIGRQALFYNVQGKGNTSAGFKSLRNNNSGDFNCAFGYQALYSNTSGFGNTATGFEALFFNTTGTRNTATGYNALSENSIGAGNTAFGYQSLETNSAGNSNTAIGRDALFSNTTGSNNTAIGYGAGILAGFNRDNTVTLGYNSITSENNLALLGNTATTVCGGYANWTNFSDGRFKKNVKENVPGLDFINALRPVTYTIDMHKLDQFIYRDKTEAYEKEMAAGIAEKEKTVMTGFIAQEVEVAAKKTGYDFDGVVIPKEMTQNHYSLSYASFVVPLVKAVQEQQLIIEEQNKKIEMLIEELQEIKNKIK